MAMAANDLSYGAKKIRCVEDYEKVYLFRLGFAHLKEIAKIVGYAKNDEVIQMFIKSLGTETQGTYTEIEKLIYVGDQPADWLAAREAGVNFLGVSYGWGISKEDKEFPVVDSVKGIAEYLLGE